MPVSLQKGLNVKHLSNSAVRGCEWEPWKQGKAVHFPKNNFFNCNILFQAVKGQLFNAPLELKTYLPSCILTQEESLSYLLCAFSHFI